MHQRSFTEEREIPPTGLADPVKAAPSTALLAEFLATTGPEDIYKSGTKSQRPRLKTKRSLANLSFLRKRPQASDSPLPSTLDKRFTSEGKQFFAIRTPQLEPPDDAIKHSVSAREASRPVPSRPVRSEGSSFTQQAREEHLCEQVQAQYDAWLPEHIKPLGGDTFQIIEYDFSQHKPPVIASSWQYHESATDKRHSGEAKNARSASLPRSQPVHLRGASVTTTITAGSRSLSQRSRESLTGMSDQSDADSPLSLDETLDMLRSMSDDAHSAERCSSDEEGQYKHSPASTKAQTPTQKDPQTPKRARPAGIQVTPRAATTTGPQLTSSPSSMTGALRMAAAEHAAIRRQDSRTTPRDVSTSPRKHSATRPIARLISPTSPDRARLPAYELPMTPAPAQDGAVRDSVDSGLGKTPKQDASADISEMPVSADLALKERLARLEERNEALERVLMTLLSQQLDDKTSSPVPEGSQARSLPSRAPLGHF